MPISFWPAENKIWLLEGLILAAALPFLLFPNQFTIGTLLALLGLIFIETVPLLLKWRPLQAPSPIDIPLLLFGIVLGLSILITADPDLTLDKTMGVLFGLFLWRYLNRTVKTTKAWYVALAIFGLLGLGFVSLGILNAAWLYKIDVLTPIIDRLPNQIVAVPGQPSDGVHPNQIAGTLLFYFPLLWSVLIGRQRTKVKGLSEYRPQSSQRFLRLVSNSLSSLFPLWLFRNWFNWLWLGLTLLGTMALLLTQSRSGWLGGAAAIYCLTFLWAFMQPKGSRKQRHLFILAGLLTLGGLVGLAIIGPDRLVELWQDPAQETAVGSLGSLNFRQEVWLWTIVAVQDFPFTGVGLGSFRRVIRRLYPLNVVPSYDVAHAHNVYLHTAVDIGIPGLIFYLALVGLVLVLGWQAARNNAKLRPYALGLIAGLIGFHVYGLGDVLALGSKTGVAFWFLLGLVTTLTQISPSPAVSRANPALSTLENHEANPVGQLAQQR
ncbi:MAG: hypothetical protein CL608_07095 [Anaerolineaceae bacterium]|nr:hypothetical protein [Anaerolineaceae bacterium]